MTKAFPENAPADSLSEQGATSTPVLPTDLDSGPEAEGIDLMACKHVRFDVQSNTPGVGYQQGSDDEESWTSVERRKRRVRRSNQVAGSSPQTSRDEQLDVMNARQILPCEGRHTRSFHPTRLRTQFCVVHLLLLLP